MIGQIVGIVVTLAFFVGLPVALAVEAHRSKR
jgi:hypothetical protein